MAISLADLPEIMSVEQVAQHLNVCRATAYNWCKLGDIPSFKVGNTRRIRKTSLLEWISRQEGRLNTG